MTNRNGKQIMPFTPGPWQATRNASFSYSIGTNYAGDAGHNCNVVREVRCEANARLIAAAPDMFEALEKLLELAGPHVSAEIRHLAERAINKAKFRESQPLAVAK